MTQPRTRAMTVAAGAGIALSLAACGSSTTPGAAISSAGAAISSAAAKVSSAAAQPAAEFPAAPAGAKELQHANSFGGEYARYEISGTAPAAVVSAYDAALKSAGYTITSTGGGGGGWGKYGGAEAGLSGDKSGSYASVQAGGSKSGPTYFEVCVGPNSAITKDCENASDGQSQKS